METRTELDEVQDVEGTGQSSQNTSQGEHQQSSSQDNQSVVELLKSEAASEAIAELVAKEFQRNKDKRLRQVEDNVTEIQRLRELVEGKGMSFEDAEAQIQREDRDAKIETLAEQLLKGQAGQVADTNKPWTEREATILGGRVQPSDPELKRFRNQFNSVDEYLAALPDKVWQMEKRPGASGASAAGGTGVVVHEDLEAKYLEELGQIRRGDVRSIDQLKRKYRKLGLAVY